MTPSEWTRWRLQSAAASFLFILATRALDVQNSAFALGAELAIFGLRMRRAFAQSPVSLPSPQRIR